ncbi:BadF/BadG/BcrA/BcrD ATPase family protein [Streptomyces sp. NPDC058045]|uniref:BadF/BadG/BcrA/BcrD ATPase family protein n=1 Tax=Streptomyces sp. NPDC058045 TaxID=3346311 RepID=UPI0036E564B3
MLGVDSGGSGLRVALATADGTGEPLASRTPVRTGPGGIDPEHLLEQLLPMAAALLGQAGAERPAAVAVGAAGMATLGGALRERLPAALAEALGVTRLALAADAVTAYAGALGMRPGAVVAAGTGMICVGTDLGEWRRADGWGHLLGDCGGGAWIGRAGLEAAFRAHDGRDGGSPELLALAEARFGPLDSLPGVLYPRTDRPAVLASFAPDVAAAAATEATVQAAGGTGGGDPVARRILAAAAREIALSAAAVCPAGGEVALTGGLLRLGPPLLEPLAAELSERLPGVRRREAEGDPLRGALRVAAGLGVGRLALPRDTRMLTVHCVGAG